MHAREDAAPSSEGNSFNGAICRRSQSATRSRVTVCLRGGGGRNRIRVGRMWGIYGLGTPNISLPLWILPLRKLVTLVKSINLTLKYGHSSTILNKPLKQKLLNISRWGVNRLKTDLNSAHIILAAPLNRNDRARTCHISRHPSKGNNSSREGGAWNWNRTEGGYILTGAWACTLVTWTTPIPTQFKEN